MRYFTYISLGLGILLTPGCLPRMPALEPAGGYHSIEEWTPRIQRTLYRGFVDMKLGMKTIHFSGLFLLDQDESDRKHVVFQNEMGLVFFHARWDGQGTYQLIQVHHGLDRPLVRQWIQESLEFWLIPGKGRDTGREGRSGDGFYVHWTQRVSRPPYMLDYRLSAEQMHALKVWKKGKANREIHWTYAPEAPPRSLASQIRVQDHRKRIQVVLERMEDYAME